MICEKKCKLCNKNFSYNDRLKRERDKMFCCSFCAKSHSGQQNKGRKRSNAVKQHLSEINKGSKNPFYGKKHSKESLDKLSKNSQWGQSKFKFCNLSDKEKQILDGLMLSDGCLSETSRISARFTFGFKYEETVNEIYKNFSSLTFSPTWKSFKTGCYHSKSHFFRDLLFENSRWYFNNKKIVPKDIELSSLTCYWWFIGDGFCSNGNVFLCTDSFSKDENLFLIEKLKKLGYGGVSLQSTNRIRFYKKDSIRFLNWIIPSEEKILEVYKYKWR